MWLSKGPDVAPPDAWPRPFDGIPWSTRLGTIAGCVPHGLRVADVAADHAALAFALLATGHASSVIATDLRAEPLRAAADRHHRWLAASAAAGYTAAGEGLRVPMRVGPGLQPLADVPVDIALIAGVGGQVIVGMLEPRILVGCGVAQLVLQPQSSVDHVRRHLQTIGWHLTREVLVRSRGRLYPVLCAAPGPGPCAADELDAIVGPHLRRGDDPLLAAWLSALRGKAAARARHLRRALEQTAAAAATRDALREAEERIARLDAVLVRHPTR